MAGSPTCLFSRAEGQGLLPSSLPLLRCCWQQAGRSADSHREGISKAKESSLAPLQGMTRCFTPALSSGNPSPCPPSTYRKSWAQPEGPPSSTHTVGGKTTVLSVCPSPLNPPDPPVASNRCACSLVCSPGLCPLVPAPAAVHTRGGCRGAQRTTRRSSCSARPARWCLASRCLFWTFSKCCSSSV